MNTIEERLNVIEKQLGITSNIDLTKYELWKLELSQNIDWDKIEDVMEHLDWEWGSDGIPDNFRLKSTCFRLLKDCYVYAYNDKEDRNVSSGGFHVEILVDDKGLPSHYSVKFVIEEWDNIY